MKIQHVTWAAIAISSVTFAALAPQVASAAAAHAALAARATDTRPPTTPHIYRIAGLGGCEIDMRVALSADESDAPSAIRYEVLSNAAVIETVHASTAGSPAGFGNLDVFVRPSRTAQTFTVVGVDTDGLQSAPSNGITRVVSGSC